VWLFCGACLLSHRGGEDEIARAEDQTEQQGGNEDVFLFSEAVFHRQKPLSKMVKYCNSSMKRL